MSNHVNRGRHPSDPTGESMGDTHWPLPNYYQVEPPMQVAINRDTLVFIGVGEYRVLWAKALESATSDEIVIGPLDTKRTFSALTQMELKMLIQNTTGEDLPAHAYTWLIERAQELANGLEPLPIPPELYKPVGLNTGSPQGGNTQAKANTKPKEKKAPSGPITRPKAGTSTGKVWEIADQVLEELGSKDVKALRAAIIQKCVDNGVNQATAQVQYGKWKGSKNL